MSKLAEGLANLAKVSDTKFLRYFTEMQLKEYYVATHNNLLSITNSFCVVTIQINSICIIRTILK